MNKHFYIYRFIDNQSNIIYVGRTNDINRRILKEHFTSLGQLPCECYQSIEKIQYAEFENESEEVAYEAILINELKPKYNVQFKDDGNFEIKKPIFDWKDYIFPHDYYLEYLKNRKNKTQDIKDFLQNHVNSFNHNNNFIETGYRAFDCYSAISSTDLILIAGVTSVGKTTYALNICSNMAIFQDKKILYINLKEDSEILIEKLIAKSAHLSLDKIRKNRLSENEIKKYVEAVDLLSKDNIKFSNLTYENKTINGIINVIKSDCYDLIVIDDLQSIVNDKEIYSKDKTIEIMQKLKSLTTDIKTPVIILYGIPSGKVLARSDHRPILSDLEYGSMESFPDTIQLLYRDDLYHEDSEKKNILELIMAKSRMNNPNVIELGIIDYCCLISNIEEKEIEK